MTKLFIATPAYSGKVHVPYAVSLSETTHLLASNGVNTCLRLSSSGSLLVAERNRLLRDFLNSDCTHILMIDSDLGWPAQAVIAMIMANKDIVAGVYPSRIDNVFMFRAVLNDNSSIVKDGNLLLMDYIPAGFMLIKREVIEKMNADNPQLYFKPKKGDMPDGFALFNTELFEGEFWGEDYTFCRVARNSGFKILVDPLIQFDHAGVRGTLMQVLTDDKEKAKEKDAQEQETALV